MGYASTIIIVWGVDLTATQTKLLRDIILPPETDEPDEDMTMITPLEALTKYDPIPETVKRPQYKDGIELTQNYHDRPDPRFVHYAHCFSHDSDSRVDDLHFEIKEGFEHSFGIYCGSRGYAYQDNIEDIIAHIPQRAKSNFEQYCAPILAKIAILTKPSVRLVTQVW